MTAPAPRRLSENFTEDEFRCRCSCGGLVLDPRLVPALEEFRERCSQIAGQTCPVIIESGYRCARRNKAVGGDPTSQHLVGRAADVKTNLLHVWKMIPAALSVTAFRDGGIGIYPWGLHVDVRDGPARWSVFFGGSQTWEFGLRCAENYYQQGRLYPSRSQ